MSEWHGICFSWKWFLLQSRFYVSFVIFFFVSNGLERISIFVVVVAVARCNLVVLQILFTHDFLFHKQKKKKEKKEEVTTNNKQQQN